MTFRRRPRTVEVLLRLASVLLELDDQSGVRALLGEAREALAAFPEGAAAQPLESSSDTARFGVRRLMKSEMSLAYRERRLRNVDRALRRSDPGLAAMLSIFTQLK